MSDILGERCEVRWGMRVCHVMDAMAGGFRLSGDVGGREGDQRFEVWLWCAGDVISRAMVMAMAMATAIFGTTVDSDTGN